MFQTKILARILVAGCVGTALLLSGCNVGPTYGTGKTSGQQLVDDIASLASLRTKTTHVETRPRPDLVLLSNQTGGRTLPEPQENVAQTGGADWPESPEERRQRLRDEATANQDNPRYVSPIVNDTAAEAPQPSRRGGILQGREENAMPVLTRSQMRAQKAEYQHRQQQNQGGSANQRKYLSEPPVAYRLPAASAPVDDPGPDEVQKERKRKAATKGKEGKSKWWPF